MERCLVTGASSGLGAAIAVGLTRPGAELHLVGRDAARLEETAAEVSRRGGAPRLHRLDLEDDAALASLSVGDRLDVLVHAAGRVALGPVATLPVAALDAQYRLNTRVPYVLTQQLMPALVAARGQIVLVNSGAGLVARATWTSYAMTKYALRAFADALRDEVKADGIRVLSVFPGRTATAMQAEVHRQEGKPYDPSRFMRAEDVATMVTTALALPRTANVHDINIRHPE